MHRGPHLIFTVSTPLLCFALQAGLSGGQGGRNATPSFSATLHTAPVHQGHSPGACAQPLDPGPASAPGKACQALCHDCTCIIPSDMSANTKQTCRQIQSAVIACPTQSLLFLHLGCYICILGGMTDQGHKDFSQSYLIDIVYPNQRHVVNQDKQPMYVCWSICGVNLSGALNISYTVM